MVSIMPQGFSFDEDYVAFYKNKQYRACYGCALVHEGCQNTHWSAKSPCVVKFKEGRVASGCDLSKAKARPPAKRKANPQANKRKLSAKK